jgi:hypothetical protein
MLATVKRRAELLVDQLRSRAKRAPFATSVQGQVLIKGVDIDQTLVIAEHELKRGRFASVLTLWGIRDQVYTEAQAQRVSYLYFQFIDTRKDYFDVWHFTWAISNIYRNGSAAVRAELELAYQDAKERAKAAGGWADGLANRDILMGDIHPPARHFVQTHVVAPGTPRYLQSLKDYRPFRIRPSAGPTSSKETSMSISHTAHVTLNEPSDQIDLEAWLFELSDSDYQACAKGHRGAGVSRDEHGRGMINVESIGGNLIVQHYRCVRSDRSSVEMYSPASRVYLFHVVPVAAAVRWTLEAKPETATTSDFACTVQVDLPPVLALLGRLSLLGHFLGRHVDEEARGFAADIAEKHHAFTPAGTERVPQTVG